MIQYQLRSIGEIAKVKGGKRLPKGMGLQDEETLHPYLRIVDFDVDGLDRSNIKYISDDVFEYISRYTISSDDIYISIAGTIGRVGIIPGALSGANLTENAAKLTDLSPEIDKHYLLFFLRSNTGYSSLLSKAGGTSQPKLALFRIAEIEFPCPPVHIQHHISSILITYDNLIENNRRRIALLEKSARLLYREWFVHLRFPGYEHTGIIDGVPEGWDKKTLEDIAVINEDSLKTGFQGKIEYIDISCVGTNSITNTTWYDFEEAPGRARRILKHKDIIWSCVRPNRKSHAFIWQPHEQLIASTGFAVISAKHISPFYLYQAITTDDYVGYLTNRAGGAAYPAVTSKVFEGSKVLVPPVNILQNFDDFVENAYNQIDLLQKSNKKLIEARDLLLPRLMNGEVSV